MTIPGKDTHKGEGKLSKPEVGWVVALSLRVGGRDGRGHRLPLQQACVGDPVRGCVCTCLLHIHSDNGGPVDLIESGANNSPLRGGKYSVFEGGMRAAAFAAGGNPSLPHVVYLLPPFLNPSLFPLASLAGGHCSCCGQCGTQAATYPQLCVALSWTK